MSVLYKGAGPGTYWWLNDARLHGFSVPPSVFPSPSATCRHIAVESHPSPYISLTTSFAVAVTYASVGPQGAASPTNPGYVYEIDPSQLFASLHDPVFELSSGARTRNRWSAEHDGNQDLILGIAAKSLHGAVLTTAPRRPGANLGHAPQITPELHALVFAIRDAEVLSSASIPKSCIVTRHTVS